MKSIPAMLWVCLLSVSCAASEVRGRTPTRDSSAMHSPSALYAQGLDWAHRGDMVRAEQYMALAVRAGYPEHEALVALVDACLAASRLRSALNYAEPHLRRHPDAWRVRLLVASVHAALGHDSTARRELRRVTAHPNADADAHYLLALVLDQRFGDRDGASAEFRAYVDRAPDGEHAPEASAWLAEHAESTQHDAVETAP